MLLLLDGLATIGAKEHSIKTCDYPLPCHMNIRSRRKPCIFCSRRGLSATAYTLPSPTYSYEQAIRSRRQILHGPSTSMHEKGKVPVMVYLTHILHYYCTKEKHATTLVRDVPSKWYASDCVVARTQVLFWCKGFVVLRPTVLPTYEASTLLWGECRERHGGRRLDSLCVEVMSGERLKLPLDICVNFGNYSLWLPSGMTPGAIYHTDSRFSDGCDRLMLCMFQVRWWRLTVYC